MKAWFDGGEDYCYTIKDGVGMKKVML